MMYQVIQSSEIRTVLKEQGVEPGVADADAFGKVIATDASKWSKIIQRAKVTAE
jgi:tripartite-type tricarboxylate transporter receptor subunit TctC